MTRILAFALALVAAPLAASDTDPKAALDRLVAADREFSSRSARAADVASGLAPMFDAQAVMPVPGKGHVVGRDAIGRLLRENIAFREGTASWSPVRGGISADYTHGFTYGFLTLTGGDPARRERKYLAYWIRRPEGWRVLAYRMQVREPGEVSKEMMPPSLPAFTAPAVEGTAAHEQSVAAAEKSFSDRAQLVGLKKAFREFGREDAMNMYNGSGFAVGLDAVTAGFKDNETSPIHWSSDQTFAASSGDLAVSIGTIRANGPGEGPGIPFFTIWRRDRPDMPWRYIAE